MDSRIIVGDVAVKFRFKVVEMKESRCVLDIRCC